MWTTEETGSRHAISSSFSRNTFCQSLLLIYRGPSIVGLLWIQSTPPIIYNWLNSHHEARVDLMNETTSSPIVAHFNREFTKNNLFNGLLIIFAHLSPIIVVIWWDDSATIAIQFSSYFSASDDQWRKGLNCSWRLVYNINRY